MRARTLTIAKAPADVFVHIPKTGGSTIRSIASRQYGLQKILLFEPDSPAWSDNQTGKMLLSEQVQRQNISLIAGHNPFGLHAQLKSPARYFAFVRDPIDRYVSEYHTAGIHSDHRLRAAVIEKGLTLDAFFDDAPLSPGDFMARFLAGAADPQPVHADAVIDNIENAFAIVG